MIATADYALIGAPAAPRFSAAWRAAHAFDFLLGGTTFIAGTALLLPSLSSAPGAALASAAVYTLGSLGFLAVDLQELASYSRADEAVLRANIFFSATGSLLYVVGSVGYVPSVAAASPQLGPVGFIAGSAAIFASQCWKLWRIAHEARAAGWSADALSAAGVEGGACAGALLFLVGTALAELPSAQTPAGAAAVVWLWMAGSLAFTAGGSALAVRHFRLGLA